jgi:hypothetical protein
MKIDIKKTHRAEIATLREQLIAALDEHNASNAELTRLNERQQKLQDEIIALENAADSESEEAAAKLATKRVQLENVTKKISQFSNVDVRIQMSNEAAVLELLRKFARAATAATGPGIEAYAKQIADKIRAWCKDDATARHIAFQTPAAMSLAQTYSRRFGDFSFTVTELKLAITRADEILSEEIAWNWDAKN